MAAPRRGNLIFASLMTITAEVHIGIAWWNTGLSPTKASGRASSEEIGAAAAVLVALAQMGAHFIVLGEVASDDVTKLRDLCVGILPGYLFIDSTSKAGRSRFDTCIVFRPDIVSVVDQADIVERVEDSYIRIGQHFEVTLAAQGKSVHLIASHWASRLNEASDSAGRYRLAEKLRDKVIALLRAEQDAYVVLLGDYNDEPFDTCITETLRATRDRDLVIAKRELLYNPFWRHLSSYEHADANHQASDKGTYFHKGGNVTRWRTFDHMMFSRAFLGSEGWRLDEHATRVVHIPGYTAIVEARSNVFDHLPIYCRVNRRYGNA